MEDVSRELDAIPANVVMGWTLAMSTLLASDLDEASQLNLALATGPWLGVVVTGRLIQLRYAEISHDLQAWSARLTWANAKQGRGPLSERLPL